MCSRALRGVRALWWISLSSVLLGAVSASLWAQTVPLTGQAPGSANQPFSSFDDSLTRAADTLLLSPAQITVSATAKTVVGETPNAALAISVDPRPHVLSDGGISLAAARLDLLRPAIDTILRNRGVPIELAAMVVVESGGRATALSPKGARGLWQLMPETARRYGLRVDEIQDDRIDLFKATDAAARYLHDLYSQFGNWKLALAAYNTGESNVESAILRAHSQDFDQLANLRMLPVETRAYVPRVLSAVQSTGQLSPSGEYHPAARAITVFAVSNR